MKTRLLLSVVSAFALWQSAPSLQAQTTLANALDATNLVWETGGTGGVGWYSEAAGLGDNTFDGIDSAHSGQIGDNSETWFQTTVVGPGSVSFWWQAYSEPNVDWLEFYVGSNLLAAISGADSGTSYGLTGWEYCSFPVPTGTNVLRWRYAKDASGTGGTLDYGEVDRVSYVTSPPPLLQQALNTYGVVWSTSGSLYTNGWFSQTNMTHDGQWAAQSGAIWHNQTNWLQATISGITNVSFWWAVSSQTNKDVLEFYTNGVLAKQISGVTDWKSNYFKLPSGTNALTWLYRKNDTFTRNSDCGWLDQVTFSPSLKPLPFTLQTPVCLPDGRTQLTVVGEVGCACRIEFSTNVVDGAGWTELTNFTTLAPSTTFIDPAASNTPLRYYRAVAP